MPDMINFDNSDSNSDVGSDSNSDVGSNISFNNNKFDSNNYKSHNDNNDNKIEGIDNINIITNGSIDDMTRITNPNQKGSVINKNTNSKVSDITPMIMIINQGLSDYKDRLSALIDNGGDMDMFVEYFGRTTTAREIATSFRNY
tara:strand:+ start:20 stop:451 length:432 start_codon:yes stop_codon:yes gene_type:complete